MERHTHVTRSRRLGVAIGLNVGIVVAQVVAAVAAGSVGLFADAGHNLTDVLALTVSLVAVRLAGRARTQRHSFGLHRATVLAALFNAAMILIVCVVVVVESIGRLRNPEPVDGAVVVVFALVGALLNGLGALVVHDRSNDLNMRSALLHLVSDALTSVAVALVGVVMLVTGGWFWLDPAVALAIAALIAWQGWRLARSALDILLESTPAGLDPGEVADAMQRVDGVDAVHDLHAWSLSSELTALSAHVVLSGHPTLEEAQVVGSRVKSMLGVDHGIAHATLELECEPCEPEPFCDVDGTKD